ncbi:MAG: DivIVA domain-containing protein, partial [Calditrichia bacterium]
MKLTPLDIKKQEFRKTLRGFDPIEVNTFLEMVAEEYERVLEDNKRHSRKLVEMETKLKDFQQSEKNLRETLLNVQEVKKQSEETSRKQADMIIKEAEIKGMEIMENARKSARRMRDEVAVLKTQKESFLNRLKHILISQIELLSVLEIDDAVPEEAQEYLEKTQRSKKSAIKDKEPFQEQKREEVEDLPANSGKIQFAEEESMENPSSNPAEDTT